MHVTNDIQVTLYKSESDPHPDACHKIMCAFSIAKILMKGLNYLMEKKADRAMKQAQDKKEWDDMTWNIVYNWFIVLLFLYIQLLQPVAAYF